MALVVKAPDVELTSTPANPFPGRAMVPISTRPEAIRHSTGNSKFIAMPELVAWDAILHCHLRLNIEAFLTMLGRFHCHVLNSRPIQLCR
jgi:hypothetical protein